MAIAGEISYKMTVDTKDLKKGLQESSKAVEKSASDTKKNYTKALKGVAKQVATVTGLVLKATAAAAASATAALTSIAADATKSYAEYEQLIGGVNKLFGESSAKVQAYADEAFSKVGISANEYMNQVTSFSASLLQSLGGDTERAADVANLAMIDMADNANTFGSSVESIQNAYQGFAKQNFFMLDNLKLGYSGSKKEMERLLEDAEALSGVHYDISSFADIVEAIHVVQESLEIAGTTANEAGTTFSGSLQMAKAAWTNLVTEIAKPEGDIGAKMDDFVTAAEGFADIALPILERSLLGAVDLINGLAPKIIAALPGLVAQLLPAVLEATVSLIDAIVAALPSLISTITRIIPDVIAAFMKIFKALTKSLPTFLQAVMDLFFALLDGILENLPDILMQIVDGVLMICMVLTQPENLHKILEAAVMLLHGLIDAIPRILDALAVALPDIISSIVAFFLDPRTLGLIVDAFLTLLFGLVATVPKVYSALFEAFSRLFGDLWNKLGTTFTDFNAKLGNAMGNAFKNAINSVLGFIDGMINRPIGLINKALGVINAIPGVNIPMIPKINIGRMATGGIVPDAQGGHLILAGEGGQDEWVVPESKMASMIAKLNEAGANTGGVTINIQGVFATSEADQRRVAEQIYEKLKQINQSKMGAYL